MKTISNPLQASSVDTAKIDAVLTGRVQEGEPGFTVGVAVGGRPVYRRAFGVADVRRPELLRPDTVMSVGSISKHFAAFAFLLLCDDGVASPDDRLGRFLPHLHPANQDAVMRDVMGHVSGLWDACDASILANGVEPLRSVADLLDFYRQSDGRNFAPREGWDYNNGGYELVTAVIEAISGATIGDFLTDRVFRPLGMKNSQLLNDGGRSLASAAVAHVRDSESDTGWQTPKWGLGLGGAGGVVSTVDDMLVWLAHMREPWLGSTETWSLMKQPQQLRNGFSTTYGMGLSLYDYRGVSLIGHTGGGGGSNAQMIMMPEAGVDLIIQSNRGDLWSVDLSYQIMDILFGGPVQARKPGAWPGAGKFYNQGRNSLLELRHWDDKPALAIDDMVLPIIDDDAGAWTPPPGFDFFRYRLPPHALSDETVLLEDYGEPVLFTRCWPSPPRDLSAYAGRYHCVATGAFLDILPTEEVRFQGGFGQASYLAEQVGDQVWTLRDEKTPDFARATLRLDEEGGGLTITTSRNRCMRFQRCA